MIARKTSVFPVPRQNVFTRLQQLETLQYIAAPYATFAPVDGQKNVTWQIGSTSVYRFRLLGFIPFGTHTIRIERFDMDVVQSRENNEHVRVWDHKITLCRNLLGCKKYLSRLKDLDAPAIIRLLYNKDVCKCSSCGGKIIPISVDPSLIRPEPHLLC